MPSAGCTDEPEPQAESAHIELSLDLAPGERIRLMLEAIPGLEGVQVTREDLPPRPTTGKPASGALQAALSPALSAWRRLRAQEMRLDERWLPALALLVYLILRLAGLPDFPTVFSAREALPTVLAADLLRDGLRSAGGELLPAFIKSGEHYFGAAVYFQIFPYLLFGESIWAARGASILATLLAALLLMSILRDGFKSPHWWSGVLLLSAVPAWFYFSRLAFEVPLAVACYAASLWGYLRYRLGEERFLYLAVALGFLAFYTYPAAWPALALSAILLLGLDWKHHRLHSTAVLRALGLAVLLALPLARFNLANPAAYTTLLQLDNPDYAALPAAERAVRYAASYLVGFNPLFWFFAHDRAPFSQAMPGYSPFHWTMLPLVLGGLWQALRRFKEPAARLALVSLLAAPAAPALTGLTVENGLFLVIPLAILAAIGLSALLQRLEKWKPLPGALYGSLAFFVLAAANLFLLNDALQNIPRRVQSYGYDGQPYRAHQVFSLIRAYNEKHPGSLVYLSPNWASQPEVLLRFFLPDLSNISLGTPEQLMDAVDPEIERSVFLMTAGELQLARESGKFKEPTLLESIPYPDGRPAYYLAALHYRDEINQILQREKEGRQQLLETQVFWNGEPLRARHSALDMGAIENIFDSNPETLIRTAGANPLVLELEFAAEKRLDGLQARLGAEPVQLTVRLQVAGDHPPVEYLQKAGEVEDYKEVLIPFETQHTVRVLRLEVLDILAPDPSHVHLWEVKLLP